MQLFYAPDLTTPPLYVGRRGVEALHPRTAAPTGRHAPSDRRARNALPMRNRRGGRPALHGARRGALPRLRTDALPPDDGRGADQEYRTLRVVPRKGDRGGRERDRPAPVRTFGAACAQNRTCRAGRRFGHEAVAQSLLSRAASAHPAGRPARRAVRRAAADRPLRRAPYGKTPSVRHAPPARKPAGAHRPRRRLLAR